MSKNNDHFRLGFCKAVIIIKDKLSAIQTEKKLIEGRDGDNKAK